MDRVINRRQLFQTAAAGTLAAWAGPRLSAQQAPRKLTDKIAVINGGPANIVAFNAGDSFVLVDGGAPNSYDQVTAALKTLGAGKVATLFNTHYHLEQTGNNEQFSAAGAKIIAQMRTKQYMAADVWLPDQDRYQKARPKAALPTETFLTTGSMNAGGEQIEYGYLLLAHTSGDAYVYFKNANVIAVGDVASPQRDPSLDWYTGAWIGGRVDAMDDILRMINDQTRIVPSYGPVMTKAEFKIERDMMEEVRARLWKQVREGDGPKDMLEGGLLKGLTRMWENPYKFLYDAAKGMWAHHDKLDANVV